MLSVRTDDADDDDLYSTPKNCLTFTPEKEVDKKKAKDEKILYFIEQINLKFNPFVFGIIQGQKYKPLW